MDILTKGNILLVDDTPANLRLLSNMLKEQGYKVRSVINGQMALTVTHAAPPDLILLDINMPGMNGYEVCGKLKADETTHDIPIIFISALDETQGKVKAFTVGGVDYITKPFQFEEVLARVETHLALRRLQQELEQEIIQRDKLIAELDAYAHTVAHDLKNPLTAMIGFSSMLETRFTKMSEEDLGDRLHMIAQSGHKMTNIIDELLLLASVRKMDEVQMEALDMGAIVKEAANRLSDLVEEYQAEIIIPENWPAALGHGPWVEEIWANYISNAIKYGGLPDKDIPPRVELGYSKGDTLHRISPLPDPTCIRFWVRDNGQGLTPADQARLFTPFERLSQVRAEGHGLGLSIVQRIAEKLGGHVGVESQVGHGSTFSFTLPCECQVLE
ncbi:MAG: hybrid sensor histidine kinase/response regulator [Anaerolineae bacterium]|nr:hybrid sensor histidine kinase/response regulator [Anaerolineae bacterium]